MTNDKKLQAVAHVPDDQKMTIKITPQEGRVLSVDMLGKHMVNFANLIKACHKEAGDTRKASVNLLSAGILEDGSFEFTVCLLPIVKRNKRGLA